MRTRLFSCGQALAATISQLKEAVSSIVVCWMASSILIMLHPGMVLTQSATCDELVYQPKLPSCTIDDDELPILSISVNCTSGLVVVNRADFTHEDLEGKAVVDVVLEYNATNITTGESEIIEVARNSLEHFEADPIVFQDDFSRYEFKACVAFQTYPCWIFNEQNLSCTFDIETATSSSLQSHTMTTTSASSSSAAVVSTPQGQSSSSSSSISSITSTTGPPLITTQLTTTPSSTSSGGFPPPVPLRENDNTNAITAIIVPSTIVGFGVIVVLVVCFISISGRYFWSKNRGEHHTYIEAAESDTNLDSFPKISLDALSSIGSIATEYEGVRFELALMNGGEPPPMYAEKEDSNLLNSSSVLMNKKNMQETEQNLYTNLNSNQVQCNSVISTRHPPLQTNVSSISTNTHIYRLNTVSSYDEGYVGTLKSIGEDDGMLSEVASDLDQSVIMGYDENDQIFQENGSESTVASPTADHTFKPFPKQQIIEEHRQMEERLRITSFGGNTDGYICDQETIMDTVTPDAKANVYEDPPYLHLPYEDELLGQDDSGHELSDVNNKKLEHISVENTCSIHSQKQIMNTNSNTLTDNKDMAITAEQTFLSCVSPSITIPETTSTNIQANQPATSDGYLSSMMTTMENTPHNQSTATSSDDYISNSPIDALTSIEHNDNAVCTPLPELDNFVIEIRQTLPADSMLSIAPLQGGDGYITEQGQDATISGLTHHSNGYISSCTMTNDQVITTGSSPNPDTYINIPLIESMEEEDNLVDAVQEPSDVSIQIPEKLTLTTQEGNDGYICKQEDSNSITYHTTMYPAIDTASTNTERNSSKANSSITTALQLGGSHTNTVAPGIVDRVELMDSYMPYRTSPPTMITRPTPHDGYITDTSSANNSTPVTSTHQPPTPHDGYITDSSSANNSTPTTTNTHLQPPAQHYGYMMDSSTPATSTDPQQPPFPFDDYISSDFSVSSSDSVNPSPDIVGIRPSVFFNTSESPDRGYVCSSTGSASSDTVMTDHQTHQANTELNNRLDDGYVPLSINTKSNISTYSIQEPISETPPTNGSSVPPTIDPSPDYIQLPMGNQTNITKTNSGLDGYIQ